METTGSAPNESSALVPSYLDPVVALVQHFLDGKITSSHTHDAYRRDLICWLDFCGARDVRPLEAWPDDVQRWIGELAVGDPFTGRRPEAGTTRARRLGAVSSWYRWLIRNGHAQRNPAMLLKEERPVRAPRKAPALSDAEAGKLLATADADRNPRTAAIAWLLLTTGIRVGELVAANIADQGQYRGFAVLNITGKGGKIRPVRIAPSAHDRVEAYLATRTDVDRRPVVVDQAGAGTDRPLIATLDGNRIDRQAVRLLLRRLAKTAGLSPVLVDRLTPHSTRATYITASIAAGVPIRDIQEAAGHASPVTTEGYDRLSGSVERSPAEIVARLFDADRLDALRKATT